MQLPLLLTALATGVLGARSASLGAQGFSGNLYHLSPETDTSSSAIFDTVLAESADLLAPVSGVVNSKISVTGNSTQAFGIPLDVSAFAAELAGYFVPETSGEYTFRLDTNSAAQITIGSGFVDCDTVVGSAVVAEKTSASSEPAAVSVELEAGALYLVNIAYYNVLAMSQFEAVVAGPADPDTFADLALSVVQATFDCNQSSSAAQSSTVAESSSVAELSSVAQSSSVAESSSVAQSSQTAEASSAPESSAPVPVSQASSIPSEDAASSVESTEVFETTDDDGHTVTQTRTHYETVCDSKCTASSQAESDSLGYWTTVINGTVTYTHYVTTCLTKPTTSAEPTLVEPVSTTDTEGYWTTVIKGTVTYTHYVTTCLTKPAPTAAPAASSETPSIAATTSPSTTITVTRTITLELESSAAPEVPSSTGTGASASSEVSSTSAGASASSEVTSITSFSVAPAATSSTSSTSTQTIYITVTSTMTSSTASLSPYEGGALVTRVGKLFALLSVALLSF